jgi:hypothetical protein
LWLSDVKGSGIGLIWYLPTIMALLWKDCRKSLQASRPISDFSLLAETRTEHLPNTNGKFYSLSQYIINCTEQSLSWEADCLSDTPTVSALYWTLNSWPCHMSSPLNPFLNQLNPLCSILYCSYKITLNCIPPSKPMSLNWTFCTCVFCHMHATCPAHLIFLDLKTMTRFTEDE